MLHMMGMIYARIYNVRRGKGKKAEEPIEQFQPDYVKKAKKEYDEQKKSEVEQSDVDELMAFWKARNPGTDRS